MFVYRVSLQFGHFLLTTYTSPTKYLSLVTCIQIMYESRIWPDCSENEVESRGHHALMPRNSLWKRSQILWKLENTPLSNFFDDVHRLIDHGDPTYLFQNLILYGMYFRWTQYEHVPQEMKFWPIKTVASLRKGFRDELKGKFTQKWSWAQNLPLPYRRNILSNLKFIAQRKVGFWGVWKLRWRHIET